MNSRNGKRIGTREVQRATDGDEASGIAYKIGQVVQVYSKSAKDWVDAKVISIENGLVTVNYSGPDGTMMSKTLRETDLSDLRPITRENLDARNERMSRL